MHEQSLDTDIVDIFGRGEGAGGTVHAVGEGGDALDVGNAVAVEEVLAGVGPYYGHGWVYFGHAGTRS